MCENLGVRVLFKVKTHASGVNRARGEMQLNVVYERMILIYQLVIYVNSRMG